jgi:uncharacterized YigZ family protein
MKFILNTVSYTYEIKKSKFIAYLFEYKKFDEVLLKLKQEHPKARHFVSAFRYLNEFNQIVEGSSDDGEPKNTSGKPTLAVLQGNNLINTAIITVRYFGGIKLGTGGLVKAYSTATNLVIENSELHEYIQKNRYKISVEYSNISLLEYNLEKLDIKIKHKEFDNSGLIATIIAIEENFKKLQKIMSFNVI